MRGFIVVLAVLTMAACEDYEDPVITDVNATVVSTYAATVAGLPARPAVRGNVSIDTYVAYFIANAVLTGLNPGTSYQWKTYFGSCANKLTQLGPTAIPPAYAAIVADASGAGAAKATVAGRLKADSTYSVRVYTVAVLTPAPVDTVFVACGDLNRR